MTWKIASLYTASVIGAGFASGQEIVQFFAKFGSSGFIGVLISAVLLSRCGGTALRKCAELKLSSYNELIAALTNKAAPFFDLLYTLFIMLGLAVMLAGTEEALARLTNVNGGMFITALLVLIPLIFGQDQVLNLNSILVPILVLFMTWVSVATIVTGKFNLHPPLLSAVPAGCLYAGYNYGFSLAIFAGIGRYVERKEEAERGGWMGGIILGFLLLLASAALLCAPPAAMNTALPMLTLAEMIDPKLGMIYTVIIWIAMYTTALAHAFALSQRLYPTISEQWWKVTALVLIAALVVAQIGFVPLIKYSYPAFGFIGLYLIYKMHKL